MADDIFLKIKGVDGESKDTKHKGEIDIHDVSFNVANPTNMAHGGGGGHGKATMSDIHVSKNVDKASHHLAKATANGEHFPEAVFTFRKQGKEQQEYLIVTMTDVLISSWQFAHGGNSESVSFSPAKIKYDYKEQKIDGSLGGSNVFTFDVKANKVT